MKVAFHEMNKTVHVKKYNERNIRQYRKKYKWIFSDESQIVIMNNKKA